MADLTLESLNTFDIWPFEIVQDARCIQQEVALICEFLDLSASWRHLADLDKPFPFVFVPAGFDDFGVEGHVLPQIEGLAYFVEVFPDVWGVGEETWPVGVEREVVCVSM